MSMSKIPSILSTVDFTAPRPGWASALASYTRKRREELNLSPERAAELAGLRRRSGTHWSPAGGCRLPITFP
jgi:hypothetical protein